MCRVALIETQSHGMCMAANLSQQDLGHVGRVSCCLRFLQVVLCCQLAPGLDDEEVGLPPAAVLYLAVSAAGCLLSAGRDEDAVAVLQGCATAGGLLTALHEAGADAAVWQAATGVAKYHCNDMPVRLLCVFRSTVCQCMSGCLLCLLQCKPQHSSDVTCGDCVCLSTCVQGAFEHCVRAYVIRCECGALGPHHPDTAAAAHNLGVVLDCLGKCSRGLQLVQEARQVCADWLTLVFVFL